MAQLLQGPLVDQPPVPEDPDAVADRLDLAEDVRGQEDRLPARRRLLDAFAERHLHQGIESARRLVEQQQVRARRERRDELDLLAVALGERADLLAGVEREALHQLVAIGDVDVAVQAPEEGERLRARHRRPQEGLAGDVRDAPVGGHRIAPGVDAEELRAPAARPVKAQQEPDRRGLARAVGPQVAVDLALADLEVEPVQRQRVAVALGQPDGADRVQACECALAAVRGPGLGHRGRGHDDDRAVGVLKHRVRDAPEQQRLHARQAAAAEHDRLGVELVGDVEDGARDAAVAHRRPRLRVEAQLARACCTLVGQRGRAALARRVDLLPVPARCAIGHPEARTRDDVDERLPDREHHRGRALQQHAGAIDRGLRVGRTVVTEKNHGPDHRARARPAHG